LTLSVGQGGLQMGSAIWDQYCTEHQINCQGEVDDDVDMSDNQFKTFFQEATAGHYVPRNLSVDLEDSTINDIKTGKYQKMWNNEFLLPGKEDAANNFARGHYTVGKEMLDKCVERIRKLVDNCDNVQGFLVQHSVGGGTGSGLGMLILERIAVDYRKKVKLGFEIYPSPNISTCIVEPYNGLLSTHGLLDQTDVSIMLDNEAIYGICKTKLHVKKPSYDNLNRIIAKVASSLTAALRFKGDLNVDMNEFQTNLVPYPRLHFMTTAMSPIISATDKDSTSNTIKEITTETFKPENFLVKLADFDVVEDKYMAISLNYRGDICSKEANSTVQYIKNNKKVTFVEWCPTGFKIGLNDVPPATVENDDMCVMKRNVVMIANNVAINRVFQERLSKKYDMMYSQRAYVHWYVGEGMEEGEFSEAREDLGFLAKDYLDVVSEQASDMDDQSGSGSNEF